MAKASGGITIAFEPEYPGMTSSMWLRPAKWRSPMKALPFPKVREKDNSAQVQLTNARVANPCRIMERTPLARTIPP